MHYGQICLMIWTLVFMSSCSITVAEKGVLMGFSVKALTLPDLESAPVDSLDVVHTLPTLLQRRTPM